MAATPYPGVTQTAIPGPMPITIPKIRTMAIRVERKTTITLTGTTAMLGEFRKILSEFPDNATVRFYYHRGDPRDPREGDYVTISVELPAPTTLNPSSPIYAPGTR